MANKNQSIIGAGPESARPAPKILDVCCGSRMFWFDKNDRRAIFLDNRCESHTLQDSSSSGGSRELVVRPDIRADFTALPFRSDYFDQVVFDPPHFARNGATSWVGLKYGTLSGEWRDTLRRGFEECFRVLRSGGTLIFKWCSFEVPLSQILALTPERPLFGHRSGKNSLTHWVAFVRSPVLGEEGPAQNAAEICHTSPNRRFMFTSSMSVPATA